MLWSFIVQYWIIWAELGCEAASQIKSSWIISDTSAHIMRHTRTPLTMHDSYHHVDVQNGVDENDVMTKIIITDMSAHITRRTKTPTLIIMRLMMLIIMMILMFMMIMTMATVIILNMSAHILRHTRTRPTYAWIKIVDDHDDHQNGHHVHLGHVSSHHEAHKNTF